MTTFSSTKRRLKNLLIRNTQGFSLVEMLITLGIFAILMATITNLIIINTRVAKRIEARTKVREETGYALKIMKKDVRNASSINFYNVNDGEIVTLELSVLDTAGQSVLIEWVITRRNDPDTTGNFLYAVERRKDGFLDFVSPQEIIYENVEIEVNNRSGGNTFIIVDLSARTIGMPEGQAVRKRVGISTRIF